MTKDAQTLHRFLTPDLLRDVLQAAGYRVGEVRGTQGSPILTSATGGLAFEISLFNPLPPVRNEGAAWADATFRAAFRVQGELPLTLVNAWNTTHRFARLTLLGDKGAPNAWLMLDMDVLALGGVQVDNLRAQLEIWDRLVQELIAYLRAELPRLARPAPQAEPAAPDKPVALDTPPEATPGADAA